MVMVICRVEIPNRFELPLSISGNNKKSKLLSFAVCHFEPYIVNNSIGQFSPFDPR